MWFKVQLLLCVSEGNVWWWWLLATKFLVNCNFFHFALSVEKKSKITKLYFWRENSDGGLRLFKGDSKIKPTIYGIFYGVDYDKVYGVDYGIVCSVAYRIVYRVYYRIVYRINYGIVYSVDYRLFHSLQYRLWTSILCRLWISL